MVEGRAELSKQLGSSWHQLSRWAGEKGCSPVGRPLYISNAKVNGQECWASVVIEARKFAASVGSNVDGRGVYSLFILLV